MESYYPYVKPNYVTKDGDTPVYVRYNYSRTKRAFISVNISINPNHWDFKRRKLKKACPEFEKYEQKIRKLENRVGKIVEYAHENYLDPTIEFVLDELKKDTVIKGRKDKSFFDHLDDFIEDSKGKVVNDVIKDYNSLKKHLKGFAKHTKQEITFLGINYQFYQKFVDYLTYHAVKPDESKGLATNTVGKQIKNLKIFLKDCMRKKICRKIDLEDFKTLTEEVDKIYLTQEEIDRIANLDLSDNEEWDQVRDYLLIGCLTGLRFSDFSTIQPFHIKGEFLSKKINKTHRTQTIPLKPEVLKIFEKYDNQLPKMNNTKFNILAKKVGEKADIDDEIEQVYKKGSDKIRTLHKKYELISSHTCRRSFCTNEYLAGTPIFLIMKISGHKTQKSFMRYLKIDENDAAEKMMEMWREREKAKVKSQEKSESVENEYYAKHLD